MHALMVATEARTPTITKSFEVALTAGVATHKKISYTNPCVFPALEPCRFGLTFCLRPLHLGWRT